MDISIQEHLIRTTIIALTGRLDAFSVSALRTEQERLLEEGAIRFLIDLRAVEFIDSAGMAALVSLLKRARQASGDVVLVSPAKEEAMRILTLTRFDQVFRMVSEPAEYLVNP